MSVTASRLGSAPITIDWSNLVSVPAGTGPSARTYSPDPALFSEAWSKLKARFERKEVGFFDCPISDELSQATEVQKLASEIVRKNQFTDCLFLGIGGSALGPSSLLSALKD